MVALENGGVAHKDHDDDGREKRTGTMMTATSHIITAVIGSGVLSLAWATAQLGWILGPAMLLAFSLITCFTSTLLADCYRSPDPVTGQRNYTYMDVVRANLGGMKVQLCGLAQYGNLVGVTIGYTITGSISMAAVKKSNCFHEKGHDADCTISNYPYMIVFGIIEILLSQIPNFHKMSWLSVVAAIMSFAYSGIGLALSIAKVAGKGHNVRTSLTGVDITGQEKVWKCFQAIGNIAFAYSFSVVLIEIQDTLKSSPPENKVMKKATTIGVITTTTFYLLCGTVGYGAFGNTAPGNFLTGFGFYEPYWLIDFANVCITVHLIGAYQVFGQPLFQFIEKRISERWPESRFISKLHAVPVPFIGTCYVNLFRLVWRTIYVMFTTLIAMIFPFFNDFVGLLGAAAFWPLTVYFPIEMYIAQTKLPKYSANWIWLKILTIVCLLATLVAGVASIKGLVTSVQTFKPFQTQEEH